MATLHDEFNRDYGLLLRAEPPWEVKGANRELDERRVTIEAGSKPGQRVKRPECGGECSIADRAPQRTWRHLDTMQFETSIRHGCLLLERTTVVLPRVLPAKGNDGLTRHQLDPVVARHQGVLPAMPSLACQRRDRRRASPSQPNKASGSDPVGGR